MALGNPGIEHPRDPSLEEPRRRWQVAICQSRSGRAFTPNGPCADGARQSLGGRFGAIARKMIPKRVNETKREARPDRRSEIERHPGNLMFPLSKVMRHDLTRARITQTLERRQSFAAVCKAVLPSVQVHWYVDGYEKSQIGSNPDDRDDKDQASQTVELR
jgi:hypothetical protein